MSDRLTVPGAREDLGFAPHGRAFSAMAFTVTDWKIVRIDALADPERLERLALSIQPTPERHS